MNTIKITNSQAKEIAHQIGMMNLMAISGGRIEKLPDGIQMKVGRGYNVRVLLAADDTYIVQRVHIRAGKVTVKGQAENIYCDEVSEVAYYASCFRNDAKGGVWVYGNPAATTEEV